QAHRAYGLGDAVGLVAVGRVRFARADLAEVTAARVPVTSDEEGGFAAFPAFEDVGASRLLTHRVQPFGTHKRTQSGVFGTRLRANLHPGGSWLARFLGIARFDAKLPSPVARRRHRLRMRVGLFRPRRAP